MLEDEIRSRHTISQHVALKSRFLRHDLWLESQRKQIITKLYKKTKSTYFPNSIFFSISQTETKFQPIYYQWLSCIKISAVS